MLGCVAAVIETESPSQPKPGGDPEDVDLGDGGWLLRYSTVGNSFRCHAALLSLMRLRVGSRRARSGWITSSTAHTDADVVERISSGRDRRVSDVRGSPAKPDRGDSLMRKRSGLADRGSSAVSRVIDPLDRVLHQFAGILAARASL